MIDLVKDRLEVGDQNTSHGKSRLKLVQILNGLKEYQLETNKSGKTTNLKTAVRNFCKESANF